MARRSKGREYAMLALFAGFAAETTASETLEFLRSQRKPGAEVYDFACALVEGVTADIPTLDSHIEASLSRWNLSRVGLTEKTILRIAVYEMLHSPETPLPVIVAEALRLAGDYAGEEPLSFMNGVLAATGSRLRSEGGAGLNLDIEFHFDDEDEDEDEEALDFEGPESEDSEED